jgi:hypothetical protein
MKRELGIIWFVCLAGMGVVGEQSLSQPGSPAEDGATTTAKVSVVEPFAEPERVRIDMPETWKEESRASADLLDEGPAQGIPVGDAGERFGVGARSSVHELVKNWAEAWSEQRVEDYLAFYAIDFKPSSGLSREGWKRLRRERVATPEFIRVTVNFMRPIQEVAPGRFRVVIRQAYASDHYSDVVEKALDVVQEGHRWRILREELRATL